LRAAVLEDHAMPIDLTDKIVALLVALGPDDVEALPPAERRRLADQCQRVVNLADPRPAKCGQRPGVLGDLAQGQRSE
jgi:hypothetical protein